MVNQPLTSPASALLRPLPDFAIIGAMRAGTTMLYDLLLQQQDICLPDMKETDFFIAEKNYAQGATWYEKQFRAPGKVCGDISPNYTKRDVFLDVPTRLYAANRDAKLIYIVRDPVARAISQYGHSFRMQQEMPKPADFITSAKGQHILATSQYAYQLKPWLDLFPRENFLIVDFDELTQNTDDVLSLICTFLGLPKPAGPVASAATNSADDLAALPAWWLRLRETKIADRLRASLPRALTQKAKRLLSGKGQTAPLPAFSAQHKQQIADYLAEDAQHFRHLTGKAFSSWSV